MFSSDAILENFDIIKSYHECNEQLYYYILCLLRFLSPDYCVALPPYNSSQAMS